MGRVHIDGDIPPHDAFVIYGLMDGDTVRYVGRTGRFRPRMNEHVTHAAIPGHQGNDALAQWLRAQQPLHVRVLELVLDGDGSAEEASWIAKLPGLLNVSPGFNRARDGSNGRNGYHHSAEVASKIAASVSRARRRVA